MNIDNLFFRMVDLGINQAKLSADTGISTGNLSDWKKGRSMPSSAKLVILADYLDCSVDYLLGRTTEIKRTSEPDKKAQQLFDIFYSFNDDGKNKLLEQALMMQSFGAYNNEINS